MLKHRYFVAAVMGAVFSLAIALPASADTSDVLTYGSLGGSNVAVGDTITASLASGTDATFYSDTTSESGVSCADSAFDATVTANPAASGVATESVTDQTFGSCTSNVIGVTGVESVTVSNLPFTASVDDSTDTITVTGTSSAPIESTVDLDTLFGSISCVYEAASDTLSGAVSNTDNSIDFTNQEFDLISGSALCFSTGYFSASYSPVQDSTQSDAAVYVN